jgi:cobalt/nickel transport system permease protein
VLSPAVLATGAILSTAGVAIGLKKMSADRIPEVAVLSSAFFIVSLIHVPIGPANAHLIMNGLVGVLLGWMAFPSILVALILQALVFQYGGFTVLGVNTFIAAAPAITAYYLFSWIIKKNKNRGPQKVARLFGVTVRSLIALAAFCAGALGVGFAVLLLVSALVTTGEVFINVARLIAIAHLPIFIIEGIITAFCVLFLKKVKPELLEMK